MVPKLPAVEQLLSEIGPPRFDRSRGGTASLSSDKAPSRPYVTLSFAQSLDGSIALRRGEQTPLSGSSSLALTHALRSHHDAILVGIGTVLADRPRLTVRHWSGDDPVPIVLDRTLRCPLDAPFLKEGSAAPIIVYETATEERRDLLTAAGARLLHHDPYDLSAVLHRLTAFEISSVMVEGGAEVIASFLRCQVVDRVVVTIAARYLGGYRYDSVPFYLSPVNSAQIDDDIVVYGGVRWG